MSHVTDSRQHGGPGIWPMQDHSRVDTPDKRYLWAALRQVDRDDSPGQDGRLVYERGTEGDIIGGMMWPASTRTMPAWSFVFPSQTTAPAPKGETRTSESGAPIRVAASDGPGGNAGAAAKRTAEQAKNRAGDFTVEGQFLGSSGGRTFPGGTVLPFGRTSGSLGIGPGRDNRRVGVKGAILDNNGRPVNGSKDTAAWFAEAEEDETIPTDVLPTTGLGWFADGRFRRVTVGAPEGWPDFPGSWHGLVVMGTDESEQVEFFHPTDPRLVAPNFEGEPTMSSLVCDMDGNRPGIERHARVSGFWRVVKGPDNAPGHRNALAWQLNTSGLGDVRGGYVFDREPHRALDNRQPILVTRTEEQPWWWLASPTLGIGLIWTPPEQSVETAGYATVNDGERITAAKGRYYLANPQERTSRAGRGGAANVLAMASINDGGPFDVGDVDDTHRIGRDADGTPINPLHISTEALYRNRGRSREDGPLDFGSVYPTPQIDGDVEFHAYLGFDRVDRRWRWWTTSFLDSVEDEPPPRRPTTAPPDEPPPRRPRATTPGPGPAPPPPGGPPVPVPGGGFGVQPDRGATIIRRSAAATRETSFASLTARPTLMRSGSPDMRYAPITPGNRLWHNRTAPVSARLDAYAAQGGLRSDQIGTADGWDYAQKPGASRSGGGVASAGGFALLPPDTDLSYVDGGFAGSARTFLVAGPRAEIGVGMPDLVDGLVTDGWTFIRAGNDMEFRSWDSTSTATTETTFVVGQGSPGRRITQAGHGFSDGDAAYQDFTDGLWKKAQANAAATVQAWGLANRVSGDDFTIVPAGNYINVAAHGFTVGATLYLSAGTAGLLTATKPTGTGNFVRVMGVGVHADYLLVSPEAAIEI